MLRKVSNYFLKCCKKSKKYLDSVYKLVNFAENYEINIVRKIQLI